MRLLTEFKTVPSDEIRDQYAWLHLIIGLEKKEQISKENSNIQLPRFIFLFTIQQTSHENRSEYLTASSVLMFTDMAKWEQ